MLYHFVAGFFTLAVVTMPLRQTRGRCHFLFFSSSSKRFKAA